MSRAFGLLTGAALLLVLGLIACGGSAATSPAPSTPASGAPRPYSGTASVGDFLQITLDPTAHTITYTNRSNGDSGTVSYTVNGDGTYAISDPSGNLEKAYEVPGYALIIKANKTGADHATPSLVTAVQTQPTSIATLANRSYNFMQFRTNSGGIEVGSVAINGVGDVSVNHYWPYGEQSGGSAFGGGIPVHGADIQADPSGSFLKVPDGAGTFDYLFATSGGHFAVDTPNGCIVALAKAPVKDFQSSYAGTYKFIGYRKVGATMGVGNVENSPVPAWLWNATIDISAGGQVSISDGSSPFIVTNLIPVADAAHLQGPGKLTDPCNGLFTFRITTATSQQDVFVTFLDRSLIFSSFKTSLPLAPGNAYEYCYGVGLK